MSDITTTIEEQAEACGTEKIYCANCIHCKLVTTEGENRDEFYLRVRCDAGKWKICDMNCISEILARHTVMVINEIQDRQKQLLKEIEEL